MRRASLPVALAVLATAAHAQASFGGLPYLPGGESSTATAVSADGAFVAGSSERSAPGDMPVRWPAAGGVLALGQVQDSLSSKAWGVSADGAVVVGSGALGGQGNRGFRWTAQTGLTLLPSPAGTREAEARGVSGDGAVAVGWVVLSGENFRRAVRWTPAAEYIPGFGTTTSTAYAASANGSVVVGEVGPSTTVQPFRWSATGGTVLLPLRAGGTAGVAYALSSDGQYAAGYSSPGAMPVRWGPTGQIAEIGVLPGTSGGYAWGISGDGGVVVGHVAAPQRAFIWDELNGIRDLKVVLETEYGLDLTGWSLNAALAVSVDGRAIAGWGINPQGFQQAWLAILGGQCSEAVALRNWLDPAGGAYESASRWSGGQVPGAADRAAFALGEGDDYTVSFAAPHTNGGAGILGANHVRLDLNGLSYTLSPSGGCSGGLSVGDGVGSATPRLEIEEGSVVVGGGVSVSGPAGTALAIRGQGGLFVTNGGIALGPGVADLAQVVVESGGALTALGGAQSTIGVAGSGRLDVEGGGAATFQGPVRVGQGTSGASRLRAIGSGATLTLSGGAVVGYAGVGELEARDGGAITAAQVNLGRLAGADGWLAAHAGASADLQELLVGVDGSGLVTVRGLGQVLVTRSLTAPAGTGDGEVDVSDTGSLLRAQILRLGQRGPGVLRVRQGGIVEVGQLLSGPDAEMNLSGGCLLVGGATCQPAFAGGSSGVVAADTLWLGPGALIDSASVALGPGGVLGGAGALPFNLTNAGAISPGDSVGVAGTFSVAGAYEQAVTGRLDVELGGAAEAQYDRLSVVGTASLDGTLRIGYIGGFQPAPGQAFTVVTAGAVTGEFASVEGPPGSSFSLAYGATEVAVTILTVGTEPAAGTHATVVLGAPAPNPAFANPSVRFSLPSAGPARLAVYDILGREIAVVREGLLPAGAQEAAIDAGRLAPGVYILRLESAGGAETRRFVVGR